MKIFVVNDVHFPYVDDKALYKFEDYLQKEKPNKLIIAGDFLDCEEISKFIGLPKMTFREEIMGAIDILKEWRKISPLTEIKYIEGNHEFRLRQFLIRQAPQLYDMLSLKDLMKLDELKIEFIATRDNATKFVHTFAEEWIGNHHYLIGHFDRALKDAGGAVKALMAEEGWFNYIQGHSHKADFRIRKDILGNKYFNIENGCLCKLEPSYTSGNNWINAFTIITEDQPHLIYL